MIRMKPTLDQITNVCIVLTCVLLSAVTMSRFFDQGKRPTDIKEFSVGATLKEVPQGGYDKSSFTLVMFVRSTCHFCTESMPLYQALIRERQSQTKLSIIAAATERPETTSAYLSAYHVAVDLVIPVTAPTGTPTLVLVDQHGVIRRVWVGKLDSTGEQNLRSALASL
jgi:hypothetical protein